jgi:mono/diheme cytochrome c family protein
MAVTLEIKIAGILRITRFTFRQFGVTLSYLNQGVKPMRASCVIMITGLLIAAPLSLWAQDAPDADQLFKTRCASCHGAKGEGLPGAKIPAIKGTSLTAEKLVAFIIKGEGGKTVHATPIVNINDEEAKALAKLVKSLK